MATSSALALDSDPLTKPPTSESPGPNSAGTPKDPQAPAAPSANSPSDAPLFKYYTAKFDIALWLGAVLVGGVGSFLFFLLLHRKDNVTGDRWWPLVIALFGGYLVAMFPIEVTDQVISYGDWGSRCFDSATYSGTRDATDGGDVKRMCVDAQTGANLPGRENRVSYEALGLNWAFTYYKEWFAGGVGNAMFPSEMRMVIWVLLAAWSMLIYWLLLQLRRRLYVR